MANKESQPTLLRVLLASPRGFCAGVDRAILIVENALRLYGRPIYVKHEIVHNMHVVNRLTAKGVIFVEDLAGVPEGARLIFSAHGVSPQVKQQALDRKLMVLDATCPLVTKVHKKAARFAAQKHKIILIGHRDHVEVKGTLGYAPNEITVVSKLADVADLRFAADENIAYITQTTLSVDDTFEIVQALRSKFPQISTMSKQDICYATTNRQNTVKAMAKEVELMLIVGSDTSSNTKRLVETAQRCKIRSFLIKHRDDVKAAWLQNIKALGVSAGASAPEEIVQQVVARILEFREGVVETFFYTKEDTKFTLPYEIRRDLLESAAPDILSPENNG